MKPYILFGAAFLALAACGGNSTGNLGGEDGGDGGGGVGGDGGDGGDGSLVDTCAGAYICSVDVTAVTFDEGADTLTITGTPFDETELAGTYVRATDLDLPGFQGYTNDDPDLFNIYIASYGESTSGNTQAGVSGTYGYQDYGYGGTFLLFAGNPSIPSEGLVQFEGQSAGVIAFIGSGEIRQSYGDVTMQVDFTDNRIKGFIENRMWVDPLTGNDGSLPSLVMNDTTIVNGTFGGTSNSYNGEDVIEAGNYSGQFGGDGSELGGRVVSTSEYEDLAESPDFSDDGIDTGSPQFPSGELTVQDTSVFIAEEVDHGPTDNPFLVP